MDIMMSLLQGLQEIPIKYYLILFNLISLVTIVYYTWKDRNAKRLKKVRDIQNNNSNNSNRTISSSSNPNETTTTTVNPIHHIVFIIAHPDDQIMFFLPTISTIIDDYHCHILCLTGANTTRQQQLRRVGAKLGIYHIQIGSFRDHIEGKDWEEGEGQGQAQKQGKSQGDKRASKKGTEGTKQYWNQAQQYISNYVTKHNIKAVFTFDDYGVSGHPNHIRVSQAVQALENYHKSDQSKPQEPVEPQNHKLLTSNEESQAINSQHKQSNSSQTHAQTQIYRSTPSSPSYPPNGVKCYYLNSVSLLRKYSMMVEFPFHLLSIPGRNGKYSFLSALPVMTLYYMTLYKSQLVWYRIIWTLISRYSYVNTYRLKLIYPNQGKVKAD